MTEVALSISDRTDLSTESGSGPIQLARARYRTAHRLVTESPLHCMNVRQCTLQAKSEEKSVRNENIQNTVDTARDHKEPQHTEGALLTGCNT